MKPIVLLILDGWGVSLKKVGNPMSQAKLPNLDNIRKNYPFTLLQASGPAVGMAWNEIGNSEVGHLSIGSGQIIEQYFSRINRSVEKDDFSQNPALIGAFNSVSETGGKVHLVGLLTSGTVHAALPHLKALIKLASQKNGASFLLHLFLDGKDSGPKEGAELLDKVREVMNPITNGAIATLIGRNFAMDRDNNWELTSRAYSLLANGDGEIIEDPTSSLKSYYGQDVYDSAIPPLIIKDGHFNGINNGDSIIFFNFREDSMRQILRPFVEDDFSIFSPKNLKDSYICTMTRYLDNPKLHVAFEPPPISNYLAGILSQNGKNQLHLAETEKYAHVTFFFNGLSSESLDGETDVFIESRKDNEKDPAMRSAEIAERVVSELDRDFYDFYVINLANADTLAHSGNFDAVVRGLEAVDAAVGRIEEKISGKNGVLIITADHGNAESMIYKIGGRIETKHDSNPVPFFLVGQKFKIAKTEERLKREGLDVNGILADVAPTILELMGLPQPPEMTGKSLLSFLR